MTRAERRRLREEHFRNKAGRPKGQVPLTKSPARFEIVWAIVLMMRFGLRVTQAAELTIVLLHYSKLPLQVSSVGNGYCLLSGEYPGLQKRAENMWRPLARATHMLSDPAPKNQEQQGWFIQSISSLNAALDAVHRGEMGTAFFDRLRQLGWDDGLRIFVDRLMKTSVTAASKKQLQQFERRILPKLAQISK